MKTNRTRHGFTLIELLVVIAIIAILADMLLLMLSCRQEWSYSGARGGARRCLCVQDVQSVAAPRDLERSSKRGRD